MSKTNGNCENCHAKQRPPQKAVWRVKKGGDELCDACRVELEIERGECVAIYASNGPLLHDKLPIERQCARGCGKPVHRGHCAGVPRAIAPATPRMAPSAKSLLNKNRDTAKELTSVSDGLSVSVMSRAEYDEKFGLAKHWVSEEVTRVMAKLDGAPVGSVVVVAPPKKDAQSIKNLRDRLYRGFTQHKSKHLKYAVKCIQVVKAGHVLVEKVQGGNK